MASVIQLHKTDGETQFWAYSKHIDALKNAKKLADHIAARDYHCEPQECWSDEYDAASGNYTRSGGLWIGVTRNVPLDQETVVTPGHAAIQFDRASARAQKSLV